MNLKTNVITNPYPHIVLDDVFPKFSAEDLNNNFPAPSQMGSQVRMDRDLFCGDPEYKNVLNNPVYSEILRFFSSASFISQMIKLFDAEINYNVENGELLLDPRTLDIDENCLELRSGLPVPTEGTKLFSRIDMGCGGVGYGRHNGGRGVHTDNTRRLFSCLYYVNTPKNMVGGTHRMYELKDDYSVVHTTTYEPKCNRLLASMQSNRALHDVDPIVETDELRNAIYIGITCTQNIWKPITDRRLAAITKNRA